MRLNSVVVAATRLAVDNRDAVVRLPAQARDFSFLENAQTESGVKKAFLSIRIKCASSGCKRVEGRSCLPTLSSVPQYANGLGKAKFSVTVFIEGKTKKLTVKEVNSRTFSCL